MRRVHRQRGEHGEDVGAEVLAQTRAGIVVEIFVQPDADVVGVEFAHELDMDAAQFGLELAHGRLALLELLGWGASVESGGMDAGGDLLFETADALHEEFVEIVADDGQKLDPLQERGARILGLMEHAAIEGEPGQFATQIEAGVVEVDIGRRERDLLGGRLAVGRVLDQGLARAHGGLDPRRHGFPDSNPTRVDVLLPSAENTGSREASGIFTMTKFRLYLRRPARLLPPH
jgi:hypothetical protein